jgi:hypothetical protein
MSRIDGRCVVIAVLMFVTAPALAQEPGGAGAEDILVTATRKPQADQNTASLLASAERYIDMYCYESFGSAGERPEECAETLEAVTRLVGDVARAQISGRGETDAYNNRLFQMHEIATWFAFVLAHALALVGVVVAFGEFLRAGRARKAGSEERVDLQIQLSGIAIRSATNGMIMMVATMAFYIAYLMFVYPILG